MNEKLVLVDIFGPTVQGEGALIGQPTWFIRLGACDWRCHHCDTDYAVDPKVGGERWSGVDCAELTRRFLALAGDSPVRMVTLSGGNPALWDLAPLVSACRTANIRTAVETQGSRYQPWLAACDVVTVSPKGPGMLAHDCLPELTTFLDRLQAERPTMPQGVTLKVPVLTDADLAFCARLQREIALPRELPLILQAGNSDIRPAWHPDGCAGTPREPLASASLSRLETLIDAVLHGPYPELANCRVLPQLHVLLWGNAERR